MDKLVIVIITGYSHNIISLVLCVSFYFHYIAIYYDKVRQ